MNNEKRKEYITYIYQVYDICMWGYIYIIYILYIILYTALFGFLSVAQK